MKKEFDQKRVAVWDISTRLFHWMLVILFSMSAYSAFQSKFGIYGDIHLYSGVAILVLAVWRIMWGIIGSDTAQFRRFLSGPKRIYAYLRTKTDSQHVGHNPLGGWSVLIVVLMLLAQAVLGLYASDGMLFSGPFAHKIDNADTITDIHVILGYTLLGWVVVHLLAIVCYRIVANTNVVKPMITGKVIVAPDVSAPRMRSQILSCACLFVACGGILWWVFV